MQIIHPIAYSNQDIRKQDKCFWGDMTIVAITRLDYEDDLFPTASSMLHELLRKNNEYHADRKQRIKFMLLVEVKQYY